MIDVKNGTQEGLLEVHMSAPVTDKDYAEVLMPALDAALATTVTNPPQVGLISFSFLVRSSIDA